MKALIFCGGVGTRLWPLSRKKSPKQFEKIIDGKSTLQLAVERLMPEFNTEDIYISTSADYTSMVAEQLPMLPAGHILGEPTKRDVGPAVAYMAAYLMRISPNEPVVILWSDHLVKKSDVFKRMLHAAEELVRKEKEQIVFIGQKPRFASENLGWIKMGPVVHTLKNLPIHTFAGFQYRPDKETAHRYFQDVHYCWNLGYFVATPAFLMSLFERFSPPIFEILKKLRDAKDDAHFFTLLKSHYKEMPSISFDNAVLEQLDGTHASVLSDDIGWSDVGTWDALKEALETDKDANTTKGKVLTYRTTDAIMFNYEMNKLVVGVGLQNIIVINTPDVVLVADKSSVKDIKTVVESLAGTEHEYLA